MQRLGLVVIALSMVTAACASPAPRAAGPRLPAAAANVSGRWKGTWAGFGIVDIPRKGFAAAEFTQIGRGGYGRLVLDDSAAAEDLPIALRRSGLAGVPVRIDVAGNTLLMRHELGEDTLAAQFTVAGDQMVGLIQNVPVPIRIRLNREPS
jgi:hypothetical protein